MEDQIVDHVIVWRRRGSRDRGWTSTVFGHRGLFQQQLFAVLPVEIRCPPQLESKRRPVRVLKSSSVLIATLNEICARSSLSINEWIGDMSYAAHVITPAASIIEATMANKSHIRTPLPPQGQLLVSFVICQLSLHTLYSPYAVFLVLMQLVGFLIL